MKTDYAKRALFKQCKYCFYLHMMNSFTAAKELPQPRDFYTRLQK